MNEHEDPGELLKRLNVYAKSGDTVALAALTGELERLALRSGPTAYLASMAWEVFDSSARKRFLLQSAELGFPAAQLDAAANYGLGLNGFERNMTQYERWIAAAAQNAPSEAVALRARVENEV
jgi:hypothetical protein